MELGLSTYSFPWAFGVPQLEFKASMQLLDLLEFARDQQVKRVQICDNAPLHFLPMPQLEELSAKARLYGIQIEVGTRGLRAEHLLRYLEIARFFQSPFLRVVIDEPGYKPSIPAVKAHIWEVLPSFRQAGVILAIENHDRFPAQTLQEIIERTDPEWVGICLDTANSLGANEGIQTVLDTLASYTVNLHLKDIRIERWPHLMGFQIEGCPAGQGALDCPALINRLRANGRCYSATLEVWSSPLATPAETLENERQWVLESLNYLKTWL